MGQPLNTQKALLYGQCVLAAYKMFDDPQGGDPLRPDPAGIPDGWELGAWIHMSDFVFKGSELKFYGIVVHEIANPDSRIIGIRGTEGAVEWLDDGDAILVPFRQVPSAGRVACGFDKIYSSLKVVARRLSHPGMQTVAAAPESYAGSFAEQLEQLAIRRERERGFAPLADGKRRSRPTVVTGHSLGAALTTLFVMENSDKHKFDIASLCTFASPRVGNLEFAHTFNKLPVDSWRIFNKRDLVPKLPPHVPILLDYQHVNDSYEIDSSGFAKNNLLCWHAMETYLHGLVPSFPLRPECA
ncbi:MAG: lipase family protein [Candidatus Acidiferrales bacterium]